MHPSFVGIILHKPFYIELGFLFAFVSVSYLFGEYHPLPTCISAALRVFSNIHLILDAKSMLFILII